MGQSKETLNTEELACIPLIILDQLKDFLIAETYTPLEILETQDGRTDILVKNLQQFHVPLPPDQGDPCCFQVICEEEGKESECRLITRRPENGSCPAQYIDPTHQGTGFTENCPANVEEAKKLIGENLKPVTIGEIIHLPNMTTRQKKLIRNNKYLQTKLNDGFIFDSAYEAMVAESRGCGH